jgi:hypothetical protein
MRRVLVHKSNNDENLRDAALSILTASVQLVDIIAVHDYINNDSYTGIIAEFCTVNFKAQKDDPPSHPMFRDVVSQSPACTDRIRVDLASAVALVREYDNSSSSISGGDNEEGEVKPTILNLRGVVFHESRCGSTLAANTMVALDPISNRVYSESGPPAIAMRICGEDYSYCTREASANLLKDVIYQCQDRMITWRKTYSLNSKALLHGQWNHSA